MSLKKSTHIWLNIYTPHQQQPRHETKRAVWVLRRHRHRLGSLPSPPLGFTRWAEGLFGFGPSRRVWVRKVWVHGARVSWRSSSWFFVFCFRVWPERWHLGRGLCFKFRHETMWFRLCQLLTWSSLKLRSFGIDLTKIKHVSIVMC